MTKVIKIGSFGVLILLMAVPVASETLKERQARSIAVLRAGILARPMVAAEVISDDKSELGPSRSPRREIVADDIFADPVIVESRHPAHYYNTEQGRGYYHPHVRIRIPPVTHHVSRSSGIVYRAESSPHNDRSTGRYVRSWRN